MGILSFYWRERYAMSLWVESVCHNESKQAKRARKERVERVGIFRVRKVKLQILKVFKEEILPTQT